MFNYTRSKFGLFFAWTTDAGFIVPSIYWRRNTYTSYSCIQYMYNVHFSLSLSYLRLPPLSISISLPISIFIPISIFLAISISLPIAVKEYYLNRRSAPNNAPCVPYIKRNILLILLYCAEQKYVVYTKTACSNNK